MHRKPNMCCTGCEDIACMWHTPCDEVMVASVYVKGTVYYKNCGSVYLVSFPGLSKRRLNGQQCLHPPIRRQHVNIGIHRCIALHAVKNGAFNGFTCMHFP